MENFLDPCNRCNGSGKEQPYTCHYCKGTGKKKKPTKKNPSAVCELCRGSGKETWSPECEACDGDGYFLTDMGKKYGKLIFEKMFKNFLLRVAQSG